MLTYPFLPWLMMRAVLRGTETQSEEPVMGSLDTIATLVPTSPYFREYWPSPVRAEQACPSCIRSHNGTVRTEAFV